MLRRLRFLAAALLAYPIAPAEAPAAALRTPAPVAGPVTAPAAPFAAGLTPWLSAPQRNSGLYGMPLTVPVLGAAPALLPAPALSPDALRRDPLRPALSVALPQAAPGPTTAKTAAPSAVAAALSAGPPGAAADSRAPPEGKAAELGAAFDGSAQSRPLSILVAGAEAVPFVKTGGLADVVDAVARGLAGRGHDVTLVLPNYRGLKRQGLDLQPAGEVLIPVGDRVERGLLLVGEHAGVRVVLVHHPGYFDRDGGPYSSYSGYSSYDAYSAGGSDDADERFGFYARAALEAARTLGIRPDVVHAHDWHAALIPAFLRLVYKADPFFAATRTVMTIHNIAFQGAFGRDSALKLGFSAEDVDRGPLGHLGGFNMLKAGIRLADAVTTVSPNYAREITDTKEFGMGMEDALAARPGGVSGILNGVDPALNDPRQDEFLARNYGTADAAEGKAANKAEFQRRLGLEVTPDAPLFVVASRLAQQKGIDLIMKAAREILNLGGQLAITGSGDQDLEASAARLAAEYPGRVAVHPFDEVLVHLLYAAGDFLLMPSRFEPCGLSQLIAQRFGTLPLVTRLGGLADTVTDWRSDPEKGDGLFLSAVGAPALAEAAAAAVRLFRDRAALARTRRTAMEKDSSWGPALDAYEALLRRLTGTGPVAPDFGAKHGTEIANKASILRETDAALGRSKPPALEYIFVRPLPAWKLSRDSGSGTNPYGHAVVRYTLPDGTQKVMNIVGAKGREMVNFLDPRDYLYGTNVFDTGSEQGGVYNRGMFSVRIEDLPPERIMALDRYYTGLAARAKSRQAKFFLAFPNLLNFLARFIPALRAEWGNCALWASKGLTAAGILSRPTAWPKEIWVDLYERYRAQDPSNVSTVSYRRVRHAVQTKGKQVDTHGLVAPLRWRESWKYWDLERFSDTAVSVPEGTMAARVLPTGRTP